MALLDVGKNEMLTHFATVGIYVALLDDVGAEITGGSYARQSLTWGTASAGAIAITNQPVFDVPAGATVGSIAIYSALTAGTKYSETSVTNESYAGDGTYTVTSLSVDLNAV